MKKLLHTLILAGAPLLGVADHNLSDLSIRMFNGAPIKVYVDGRLVSYQPQPAVFIRGIVPGSHVLRVVAPQVGFSGYHGGFERTLFQGSLFVEEAAEIHSEVDRFGRLQILEIIQRNFDGIGPVSGYDNYYYDEHHCDDGFHNNPQGWSQGHGYGYGRALISDREFNDIRLQVERATFESTKLTIAKRAISGRFVTAMQVRQLMESFTFEGTKVDFAKFAYPMVADKERFYIVYDAFTFTTSIEELDEFVARQGY